MNKRFLKLPVLDRWISRDLSERISGVHFGKRDELPTVNLMIVTPDGRVTELCAVTPPVKTAEELIGVVAQVVTAIEEFVAEGE